MNNIPVLIQQVDGIFLENICVNTAQYVILKQVLNFMNNTDFGHFEVGINTVVDPQGEKSKKVDITLAPKTRFSWKVQR